MKKTILLFFVLFLFFTPFTVHAEENSPPFFRKMIHWFDYWYRQDMSIEEHLRYGIESAEGSKKPERKVTIKDFQIQHSLKAGKSHYIYATYHYAGKENYLFTIVSKQAGIWESKVGGVHSDRLPAVQVEWGQSEPDVIWIYGSITEPSIVKVKVRESRMGETKELYILPVMNRIVFEVLPVTVEDPKQELILEGLDEKNRLVSQIQFQSNDLIVNK